MSHLPSANLRLPLWVPSVLGVAAAIGVAWVASGHGNAPLLAKTSTTMDSDSDGIPDRQELVLGTLPGVPDTDNDGYLDGEELALQTSPLNDRSTPRVTGTSIGMTARGEDGFLKIFVSIWTDGMTDSDPNVRFGALLGSQLVDLKLDRIVGVAETSTLPVNGGKLVTFDIPISPQLIERSGGATFFAVIGERGSADYIAAGVVDISTDQGILVLRRDPRGPGTTGSSPNNMWQGFGGSIFQPIPQSGNDAVPTTWTPGQVCFTRSEVIGVKGALVTEQVVEADCIPGWESYCSSDCALSLGSTFRRIDPAALVGN